jgi:Ca2+-binding EF-hand superfamily protein
MAEAAPLVGQQLDTYVENMLSFILEGDESKLDDMFTVLDRNGDGTVSRTELKTVMTGVASTAGETITEDQVD